MSPKYKSFKKTFSARPRKCPDCGDEMICLSRKFKAPKKSDREEWKVVEYLVACGFRYQSIQLEDGKVAKYPKTLKEAKKFASDYKNRLGER